MLKRAFKTSLSYENICSASHSPRGTTPHLAHALLRQFKSLSGTTKSRLKTCGGMRGGEEVFDCVREWSFVREFKLRSPYPPTPSGPATTSMCRRISEGDLQ
jgi:hypothetical protein